MNPVLQALKELGQFLGGKLDTLAASSRAPIKVDMSDSSVALGKSAKALEDAAKVLTAASGGIVSYNEMSKTLKGDVSGLAKEINASIKAIAAASKALESASKAQDISQLKDKLAVLGAATDKVAANIGAIKPADMSATIAAIDAVTSSIKALKFVVEAPDLSGIDDVADNVKSLEKTIKESEKKRKDTEILEAIKALKFEVPSEFRLDRGQVAEIVHSGSALGGVGGSQVYATKATVYNVTMALADTQYSFTFPMNTIGFRMRLRDQGEKLLYSWTAGKLPTSGDGTAYAQVQENAELVREQLDIANKTIYLQTTLTDMVVEVEVYQV